MSTRSSSRYAFAVIIGSLAGAFPPILSLAAGAYGSDVLGIFAIGLMLPGCAISALLAPILGYNTLGGSDADTNVTVMSNIVVYAGAAAVVRWCCVRGSCRHCGWTKSHSMGNVCRICSHCLICGYDLRGNVSGVCPECGADIRGRPLAALPTASVNDVENDRRPVDS